MPKQVLVVDDNDGVRRVMCEMLRLEGYETASASNGAEGVRAAAAHGYDAIVIDMILPDMTGIDAILALRSAAVRSRIVAVSGRDDLLAAARRAGADEVLMKPMNPDDLTAAVGRALSTGASAS